MHDDDGDEEELPVSPRLSRPQSRRVRALQLAEELDLLTYEELKPHPQGSREPNWYRVTIAGRTRWLQQDEVLPWVQGVADKAGVGHLVAYRHGLR